MVKLEKKSEEERKTKYFLLILIIIILIIGMVVFLVKYSPFLKKEGRISVSSWERPPFLDLSLPQIESIKEAINNPLFQELEYHEKYSVPVIPGDKGRPNPFAPIL
jgi:flagellar basal body-associated protein FliL